MTPCIFRLTIFLILLLATQANDAPTVLTYFVEYEVEQ